MVAPHSVDVLVSEWMGYMGGLFETMYAFPSSPLHRARPAHAAQRGSALLNILEVLGAASGTCQSTDHAPGLLTPAQHTAPQHTMIGREVDRPSPNGIHAAQLNARQLLDPVYNFTVAQHHRQHVTHACAMPSTFSYKAAERALHTARPACMVLMCATTA